MSGNCLHLQEPDLSHLQHLDSAGVWHEDIVAQPNSALFPRSFLLPWMLLASLVIHIFLLFLDVNPVEKPGQQHTFQIELKPIVQQPTVELVEPMEKPRTEKSETPLSDDKHNPEIVEENEKIDPVEKPEATTLILPLTPEELRSWQDRPESLYEPADKELEVGEQTAYGDVFDPRLRARLRAEQAPRRGGRPAERVRETAQGMKFFKISDRHCLMTVPGFRRENATDWYHTPCKDKTGSEQMMDRVNESLRHK